MLKKYIIKAGLVLAFAFLMGTAGWSQEPDLNQLLATDTSVTVGHLPNGLTYYIKPNTKPAQKVELRLVLKAGSIVEDANQQGLAHFMEHMAFNGLKHYPKNRLVDYLQKIGVRFGADLNANTGWDRTYFMLPIPTDNPANLEKGFQIVGDWADGALITTAEVNEERHVILEELRMRDLNAQTRMLRKFLPEMLNGSRYAYRMSGGKDSIVANADPDLIRAFYQDWYRPDLMAVIVVGDITVDKAKQLIEKYFAGLKAPMNDRARVYYEVSPYTNKNALVITDSEATGYQYTLVYPAHRRKGAATVGDFRKNLIRHIFIQSINRKLRDLAQGSTPPFANAKVSLTGSVGAITLDNEGMELDITPIDDLNRSVNAAIGALVNAASYGFSEHDINTVKKAYLPYYENAYRERNDRPSAYFTDLYATAFMKGTPLIGVGNEYNYTKALLPGITRNDINDYAKEVLVKPEHYFTMITGPQKGELALPTKTGLLSITDAAFMQQAQKDTAEAAAIHLLSREPISGKIVSASKDVDLGAVTYRLSNGVKVTVKSTDFLKDQVLFSGVKFGGNNLYGVVDKSNMAFLGAVIGTMGYGAFTPASLSDFLSGFQVNVGVGVNSITDEVHGRSSVKDIKTMLELTYLKLTSPRKDTALLSGWFNKVKSRIPLLKADPNNAFKDSLVKVMYGQSPLTPIVIPTNQEMENIDVDRILHIYKSQFGNADGFHFFFVGNVNADSLKPLIEKYLGSLPVKNTRPFYKDNGLRMVSGTHFFKFYKGTDKKSTLLDIYHGDIPYSADLALKADMLGQIMTIELLKIIREEKQWIYSGSVSATVTELPYGHYNITAQMPCGPENVQLILHELDREVAGYKQNGISHEDLDKVKKAMIEQYKEQIKSNRVWAQVLQNVLFWGQDKDDFLSYVRRVHAITADDLKATAQKLLKGDHFKAVTYPQQ